LTSKATRVAPGTSSRNSSNREAVEVTAIGAAPRRDDHGDLAVNQN